MRKLTIAAALLSALLSVAGCASNTAGVTGAATGSTSVVPTTPLIAPTTGSNGTVVETTGAPNISKVAAPTGHVNYVPVVTTEHWGGLVVVTPPRPGDLPKITTDDALKVCPQAGCASGQLPEIRLGRATTDSSQAPTMNDTLVFELIWTEPHCLPAGNVGSTEMTTLEYYACTTVVLVDASNGRNLTTLTQGTN